MPNIRLTREAAVKSVEKFFDYVEGEKENNNLSDKDVINTMYENIVNTMEENSKGLLDVYTSDYKKGIKDGLLNDDEYLIKSADKEFHKDYDELFSDYASNLLTMIDSIQSLKKDGKDVEKYEAYLNEAKNKCANFFSVDNGTLDKFLEEFANTKLGVSVGEQLEPFFNELDGVRVDDYSDVEVEFEDEQKLKADEEKEIRKQQERLAREKQEEENKKQKELQERKELEEREKQNQEKLNRDTENYKKIGEVEKFIDARFDKSCLKESEKFFKENFKRFNDGGSYIDDILTQINNYKAVDTSLANKKETNPSIKNETSYLLQVANSNVDLKKAYIGGYLSIKEHFDSKNIFQKLFSLGESIKEYKTLKQLKNDIHEKYKIDTDELDRVPEAYFKEKKETKEENVIENKEQVTRTHSKELEESLINSLDTNKNLNSEKVKNNTNELNKEKDKSSVK